MLAPSIPYPPLADPRFKDILYLGVMGKELPTVSCPNNLNENELNAAIKLLDLIVKPMLIHFDPANPDAIREAIQDYKLKPKPLALFQITPNANALSASEGK